MRLFLYIHETGKDITVWFNDNTTVAEAKFAVEQSKQSSLKAHEMEFYCGSILAQDSMMLEKLAPASHPNQVHGILLPKENPGLPLTFAVYATPSDGAANVSINKPGVISIHTTETFFRKLRADVDQAPNVLKNLIMVIDSRNQRIPGRAELDTTGKSVIRFISDGILLSNCGYTVLVDGRVVDESNVISKRLVWSFRTQTPSKLQLFVKVTTVTPAVNVVDVTLLPASCVLHLGRQSLALWDELRFGLASSLGVPAYQITAVVATRIDGSCMNVSSDLDVSFLNNSDKLTAEVDVSLTSDPNDPGIPVCEPVTAAQWEQYNRDNWVNDASGYLAVCGKMSDEEELRLVLDVVQAFACNEDNRDGISADKPVPTTAVMVSNAPMEVDAPQVVHGSGAGGGCGCHTSYDGGGYIPSGDSNNNDRIIGSLPLSTHVAMHSSLADATISADMRAKLWSGPQPHPQIFQLNWDMDRQKHMFVDPDVNNCSSSSSGSSTTENNNSSNDITSLINSLKVHGYAIISLPPHISESINHLHAQAKVFFNANELRVKEQFVSGLFRYIGYVNNPHYKKELFQLRMFSEQHTQLTEEVWRLLHDKDRSSNSSNNRQQNEGFRDAVYAGYQDMSNLATSLTADILMNGIDLTKSPPSADSAHAHQHQYQHLANCKEYIDSLFEPTQPDASFRHQLSLSNLSVFQYNAPENGYLADIHCPMHSDITLLTIIPLLGCSSGLHVYDWQVSKWMDVCTDLPSTSNNNSLAVVFTGEMMMRMSANHLLPTMHEVSHIGPGPRISTPFQCCARSQAMIDPTLVPLAFCNTKEQLLEENVDHGASEMTTTASSSTSRKRRGAWEPMNAGEFVEITSRSRISSNFMNLK